MNSSEIQNLYDKEYGSETYWDLVNAFREHADRISYVMSIVKGRQPKSILEIGCGTGVFGLMFRWQRGYAPEKVEGVDVSKFVVDRCTWYDSIYQFDACQPFDLQRKYDLVLLMEVLEHVPDPVTVMANALRHTKGNLLISTPVEDGDVDGVIHVRHVGRDDHIKWMREAGYNPTQYGTHFLPSQFCEKPHWMGWNFTLVEVQA
jgi:2-polyprenyl-3-methyl-5-hydroxy-6-metoxy-1,4-benzoquinol methylase